MMKILLLALVASAALPLLADEPDLINADRPGIADGSTTVRRGALQVELGIERDDDHQGDVSSRLFSTPLLVRYGLTKSLELRVEGDGRQSLRVHEPGFSTSSNGWAPVSIGAKYHFLDGDDRTHKPSLGVIARVFVPSGSGDFRGDSTTGDVRLAADLNFGEKWSVNPNVGVAFEDQGGRFTAALAALTVQYNFSNRFNAFVDGGFESPEEVHGDSSLILDVGSALVIGNETQLDVSVGWRAHGSTAPQVFYSAGISRRF